MAACRILLCLIAVELTEPEDRNRGRSFEFLNHNVGGIHKLCISHVDKRVFWGKNGTRKHREFGRFLCLRVP